MFYRGWQTNSTEQAESKKVDSSLSAQAVPGLVWNLKVRYTAIPPQIPNPEPDEFILHRPTPCSLNIYIIITSTASSSERDICNERIVGLLHTRICLPLLSSHRLFISFLYEVKEGTLIWRSCPSVRLSAICCQRLTLFFFSWKSAVFTCAVVM